MMIVKKHKYKILVSSAVLLLANSMGCKVILAQEASANPSAVSATEQSSGTKPLGTLTAQQSLTPEVLILRHIEEELKEKYKKEIYIPPSIQSLLYSPSEQTLLREARSGFNTQATPVTDDDSGNPSFDPSSSQSVDNPGITERALSLGGIVFLTPDDWTIWLNKRRITAAKLPREAIDLRVYKDFIELRWFDAQSNKIYPIRLRPNQTFNLDAQTFIPG